LVDAEYAVQNEFPVGSTDQSVQDQMEAAKKKEEKANKTKLDKLREKRDKLNTKIETLEGKSKVEEL
jgi:cell division protein FtsB